MLAGQELQIINRETAILRIYLDALVTKALGFREYLVVLFLIIWQAGKLTHPATRCK